MAQTSKIKKIPSPELLNAYTETVNHLIVFRVRITLPIGACLYLLFNYVDYHIYPAATALFLKTRITVVAILAVIVVLSFVKKIARNFIWFADFSIAVMAAGIIFMIYKTDGASSHYYEGINLTFWGLICMNSFSTKHNIWTGLFILALYEIAVLANQTGWSFSGFLLANCFMGSTLLLACLMNKFYSIQHFNGFVANEQLKQSEKKLAESNAKLARLYQEADQLSKIDDMTKVYNRRHFVNILEAKLQAAKRLGSFFYLVIFDIDHFKEINDSYSHTIGDKVICQVVETVQSHLRTSSYIGRYGGDEFIFIIDQADTASFYARIENIGQAVRNLAIPAGRKEIKVTLSFGAVKVDPEKYQDMQFLIDAADHALIQVKKHGRGNVFLME
ncbi:MAG: GGDEF domain-containing protein [Candidatus Omnitrophica bacterium]|nr:GGDEF domain-containing protein [Candidatus Omnitrophota bacterium]